MKLVLAAVMLAPLYVSASPQSRPAAPRYDTRIPRERQIALAMSAAPAEVAARATVYILSPTGYQKAKEGSNGFTCLVTREYVTTQEPQCYDAEGSATLLAVDLRREELRAQGKAEPEILADRDEGYREGRFIAPRKPGICYMLSKENWVFDPSQKAVIHFPGHLMFYAPYMTAKDLGYESDATMPYLVAPGTPGALMIVVPALGADHDHARTPHSADNMALRLP